MKTLDLLIGKSKNRNTESKEAILPGFKNEISLKMI